MSFLGSLFSAGAGEVISKTGEVFDNLFTSDDERLEQENEIKKAELNYNIENKKLDIEEKKIYLEDIGDARKNQTIIQTSDKTSWLGKNIHSVLSLSIICVTFYIFYAVMTDKLPIAQDKKEIIIFILGSLSTISTQVVSYFFGSSHGSAEKNKKAFGL